MNPGIDRKIKIAVEAIAGVRGRLLVALSGGVDSAVVLALAAETLTPGRVVAITGRSSSLPGHDEADAARVADHVGVEHLFVDTRELEDPRYRANAGDRCYHCRVELFGRLEAFARERGFAAAAYGAIADDLGDVRPGMRAAEEFGVLAPLLEAGFTKDDVRAVAADRGLPVREKPASACLSSRIPVGQEVTRAKLDQVDRAEAALRALGFVQLRVRHHGDVARVELDRDGLDRVADRDWHDRVVRAVAAAGFGGVEIDPAGYRQGGASPGPTERRTLYSIGPARDGGQ